MIRLSFIFFFFFFFFFIESLGAILLNFSQKYPLLKIVHKMVILIIAILVSNYASAEYIWHKS
jgi:hypothetical protein